MPCAPHYALRISHYALKLTLYLDVDEGDYKNYFGEIYKRRLDRGLDRYPCVYNQRTDEFAARYFKRLIRLLERCNDDFDFDSDDEINGRHG